MWQNGDDDIKLRPQNFNAHGHLLVRVRDDSELLQHRAVLANKATKMFWATPDRDIKLAVATMTGVGSGPIDCGSVTGHGCL